jgi:hypothetical protein
MSRESAKVFLDRLDTDANLRAELFTPGDESAERVSVSGARLVELGAQQGLAFTLEEIREAFAERSPRGELGETELDAVTGGVKHQAEFVIVKKVDKASPVLF